MVKLFVLYQKQGSFPDNNKLMNHSIIPTDS